MRSPLGGSYRSLRPPLPHMYNHIPSQDTRLHAVFSLTALLSGLGFFWLFFLILYQAFFFLTTHFHLFSLNYFSFRFSLSFQEVQLYSVEHVLSQASKINLVSCRLALRHGKSQYQATGFPPFGNPWKQCTIHVLISLTISMAVRLFLLSGSKNK